MYPVDYPTISTYNFLDFLYSVISNWRNWIICDIQIIYSTVNLILQSRYTIVLHTSTLVYARIYMTHVQYINAQVVSAQQCTISFTVVWNVVLYLPACGFMSIVPLCSHIITVLLSNINAMIHNVNNTRIDDTQFYKGFPVVIRHRTLLYNYSTICSAYSRYCICDL